MRIAVMGTGAVGGSFGARLAAAGEDVAFIARGAQLDALRARGLRIEWDGRVEHLSPVRATDDPAEVGPVDVVLFTVKLWDTEAAAEACRPMVGPETAVIPFQNGVDSADRVASVLGPGAVMGGVVFIAADLAAPGVIRRTGALERLVFGERDGRTSDRAAALLAACRRAGIAAEIAADIELEIWRKFVFLVGLSGLTTLVRRPLGTIREDPELRALLREAMAETVAVGRARGVALDPDYAEDRLRFCDTLPAETRASMLNDLDRGRRLEVEWLAGAVVRLGAEAGVPTPVNRVIHAALRPHAMGAADGGRAGKAAP